MTEEPLALRLADALEELDAQFSHTGLCGEAAAELRRLHEENERLKARQEDEPVAWVCEGMTCDEKHSIDYEQSEIDAIPVGTMLYTRPQPAAQWQWQWLTDEEINAFVWNMPYEPGPAEIRAIEARLKEKNT